MYQALYRKWRPRTFDDVVGQEHVSQTLKHQVSSGRLSHAYLFVGTRGTGKTSCAKILAKAVNCRSPRDGNPCNECSSCVGIDNGSILDVLELDAASNNGVDNVRALREEAVFTPVDVKKRVYIIDEVHMLSTAAFNALLKILEEPPAHLIFILATTELHKVPATILSRCQRHMFKRILPGDIAKRLSDIAGRENIDLTGEASELLSRLADGSLRDALSLLDQCASENTVDLNRVLSAIGLAGGEITALLSAVTDGDVPEALTRLDALYADGKVMTSVLEELLSLVRDTLVTALMPKGGLGLISGGFDDSTLHDFAARLSEERLLYMMELLRQALMDISRGSAGKLTAEICLIRLAGFSAPSNSAVEPAPPRTMKKSEAAALAPEAVNVPAVPAEKKATPPTEAAEIPNITETPPVENVPDTQPAAKPPAPPQKDDFWASVLAHIQPNIDLPFYTFLSDAANTSAVLEGDILTVKLKSAFHAKILDVPPVTEALKQAARQLLGRPAAVKIVQDAGGPAETSDKIDALRRYSNIKFE